MRDVAGEERFLHWQVAFPGIWRDWEAGERQGGFDAVIGNPPWDRMKLQQVEWFATRRPEVAHAARAADRKRMVDALRHAGDPLDAEFRRADERAGSAARVARTGGDYPLLANGDVNVYSLFVERAMALVKPEGVIGLLTPSGIASDKTAAPFFRGVATEGRLWALYDFENRRTRHDDPPFFPDVHASFKFCVLVAGRSPRPDPARCAFFLQGVSELADPDRCFALAAEDFARVNPNTGTAPVFRTRRDAEITTAIYGRLPVFVDRSGGGEAKTWPVTYERMFDMTNDSGRFRRADELEEREGAWRVAGNRFDSPAGAWLPLYEGKMVQAFDHRAASIVVNPANLHRPAQTAPATDEQRRNPDWLPNPRYWVEDRRIPAGFRWFVGWKDVTAPTNVRTIIGAVVPRSGVGNTFPVLLPADDADPAAYAAVAPLVLANLNALVLDYVARQKVQGQHLNLYIVEQLPVVPPRPVRHGPVRPAVRRRDRPGRGAGVDLHRPRHGAVRPGPGPRRRRRRRAAAVPLGRRAPPPPAREARRALLPPVRRHRPRRRALRLLDLPDRGAAGNGVVRPLSFPRPLPRAHERAGRG